MYRLLFVIFFLLLESVVSSIYSQREDDDVVILNKEETYTYELGKDGKVQVKGDFQVTYKSLKAVSAHFAEFYNDYSEIKNLKIKGIKTDKPYYGMYKQQNVFFSDSKVCSFDMPFLKAESEAVVSFTKIYNDVRYFNFVSVSEPYWTDSKSVKIVVPDWMRMNFVLKNRRAGFKQDTLRDESHKQMVYKLEFIDLPGFVREENSPTYDHSASFMKVVPLESVYKGDTVTYFETLDNLYQWTKAPLETLNNNSDIVKNKALELTKNCKNDEEKVHELTKWVQQNIRYIAFEDGTAAYRPDDAENVMQKKYGDCKGMANLLKSMLVSVGLDARLVWVDADLDGEKKIDKKAPVPFANHMICAVFLEGKLRYVDPTVKSLSFGEIPDWIQEKEVMVEDGDKCILSQIPACDLKNNIDSLSISYTFVDNQLQGKASRIFRGESKHNLLFWMNNLTESDKKLILDKFLLNSETQDSILNLKTNGLEDFLPEIQLDYDLKMKSNVKRFGNQIYINPDNSRDYENSKIDIDKRKAAFMFPYRDYVVSVLNISLPEGSSLAQLPENVNIQREKYHFSITYQVEGDKVMCKKCLSIFNPILEKNDFKQWNDDIDTLRKSYNDLVIITLK